MKTVKELLEPVTSRGLDLMVLVDTWDFQRFYESEGSPEGDFHKKIWRPFMCDYFMEGPYVHFQRVENPRNIFDEWINKFLDAYPELGGEVRMIFTN